MLLLLCSRISHRAYGARSVILFCCPLLQKQILKFTYSKCWVSEKIWVRAILANFECLGISYLAGPIFSIPLFQRGLHFRINCSSPLFCQPLNTVALFLWYLLQIVADPG